MNDLAAGHYLNTITPFRVKDFSQFKEFFIPVYQGRQFHVTVKESTI